MDESRALLGAPGSLVVPSLLLPLKLSPGAPRAVWLTRPRIKLPIYFGTTRSEGPKTQIKAVPLCVYLQLLTLLGTNLQIQTNVLLCNGAGKTIRKGLGVCSQVPAEGGLEGAAAQAEITRNSTFTLITTGAIFCP